MSQHPEKPPFRSNTSEMRVPAAVRRENGDPVESNEPLPNWLLGLTVAAACVAGAILGMYHGGFSANVYNETDSTPALFARVQAQSGEAAQVAQEQSLAELGKGIYANCQPCHQPTGLGVANQFPSLVASDWVLGSDKRLIAIILKGISGPFKVGAASFNGAMPAWEKALSDKKIAAVATYIRSSWGNSASEITEAMVASVKKEFLGHSAPWSEAELLGIPQDAKIAVDTANPTGSVVPGGVNKEVAVDLEAGKAQYAAVCIACHQPTGLGLPPVFPPLVKSEYVTGDPERMVAIVLKGVQGPITVNGQAFANIMPTQEAVLTDNKISQIVSFVRTTFGPGASTVSAAQVAEVRKALISRVTPWTEAELKSFSLKALSGENK